MFLQFFCVKLSANNSPNQPGLEAQTTKQYTQSTLLDLTATSPYSTVVIAHKNVQTGLTKIDSVGGIPACGSNSSVVQHMPPHLERQEFQQYQRVGTSEGQALQNACAAGGEAKEEG